MYKTKTTKNLIKILSTIISVVFALYMGVTFATPSLHNEYGTSNSVDAYLGNQQYVVINDTLTNPIPYSSGGRNFEVAIQYAYDYEFDIMIEYSLSWSDNNLTDTSNVVLHYANRDKLIIDEDYIYYAGTLSGEGKLTLMVSAEFVDAVNVKDTENLQNSYIGKSLTINIENVSITPVVATYDTTHTFYHSSSEACLGWLQYKNKSSISGGYVMIYNYRCDDAHGVKYPGPNSAYMTSGGTAIWLGGNRSYAGIGLYVITGTNSFKLKVKIAGIWRQNTGGGLTFENNILFNYSSNWTHLSYDSDNLFETRIFNYVIPANTTCYIDILDSIEVTCAARLTEYAEDSYRMVVDEIEVNGTTYYYTTNENSKWLKHCFKTNDNVIIDSDNTEADPVTQPEAYAVLTAADPYVLPEVTVLNGTMYTNGLYDFSNQFTYRNSRVALVNNTNSYKSVTISGYNLGYHFSNGVTTFYTNVSNKTRANNFNDLAFYSIDDSIDILTNTAAEDPYYSATGGTFVLPPYSCVDVLVSYVVNTQFYSYISTYGDYDVWVNLVPEFDDPDPQNLPPPSIPVEAKVTDDGTNSKVTLSVKNTTSNDITLTPSSNVSLAIYTYSYAIASTATTGSEPANWNTEFWKYYTYKNGTYTVNTNTTWSSGLYYRGDYSLVLQSNPPLSSTDVTLKPNETLVLGSIPVINYVGRFIIIATATYTSATAPSGVDIIKTGADSAYMINYSNNAYFVKFNQTMSSTKNYIATDNSDNYYLGILRPGQILELPLTISGSITINTVSVSGNYVPGGSGTLSGWPSGVIAIIDEMYG